MQISTKAWFRYIKRLSAINKKAADEMRKYVQVHGFGGNGVIDYAYALATKYGEASGAAACEMYDAIAMLQKASVPPANPAPTATYEEVARAVNGATKTSEAVVPDTVGRLVKQVAADTMLLNALRDGAQFAWVPNGDTCAFCITLASRGWQYMSDNALKNGHAEHIHAHCDCEYAIRFSESDGVKGYDPDKYLDMYYSASDGTPKDKINAMRRQHYAKHKDAINAQKRAAYAARTKKED